MFNAARQIGGGLAVAVFGSLLTTGFSTGMTTSLVVAAALLVVTITVTVAIRPPSPAEVSAA